jgi:hypothetical protein
MFFLGNAYQEKAWEQHQHTSTTITTTRTDKNYSCLPLKRNTMNPFRLKINTA